MLSTINETYLFQQDLLTVKMFPSIQQMGKCAATEVTNKICELLKEKAEINMIFAAAPSQNEFLSHLIHSKQIDWTRINAFHMDEYIGIHAEAPQSFGNFLRQRIFDKVPFKTVNYLNGHIAFNDPDVANFNDPQLVKVVELDPICRQQQVNEKCFETFDLVPAKALTLTIPTLLKANWMFCIVPFKNKANAVYNTLYGEISEKCPASILRKKENSCLYLDPESAERIKL